MGLIQNSARHPFPDLPFHVVSVKMIWTLPTAICGKQNILITFNKLTKLVKSTSAVAVTAKNIALFLMKLIFSQYGSTRVLLSENSLNFIFQVVNVPSYMFVRCPTFAAPYTRLPTAMWKAPILHLYQSSIKWPFLPPPLATIPRCCSPGVPN